MNDFKLDSEPKIKAGFKIPENYFENFSEKVLQQLPEEELKVISIFQKPKTWLTAVAAVLVLALGIPLYSLFSTNNTELDEATLENYITNQSNISQYDLIVLLEKEDLENMKIDLNLEDETLEVLLSTNSYLEQDIITN
jgi:hypothetical protein